MNCPKCKSEAVYVQNTSRGKVIICPQCSTISPMPKVNSKMFLIKRPK